MTEEYGKPNPSGTIIGDEIQLKDILPLFKTCKLKKPFICLTGGLVAHGHTQGDIDILIRKSEPKDTDEDLPLKFRITRMFPEKYWKRLHFLYDDKHHGPFTDFVPLYDLLVERQGSEVQKMEEMAAFDPYDLLKNLDAIDTKELLRRHFQIHNYWGKLNG
jgi:hypothetical protein